MPRGTSHIRAWVLVALVACSSRARRVLVHGTRESPPRTVREVTGSQVERIAEVQKLMRVSTQIPAALVDAQFLEEQIGDGRLGPSDFLAFYRLTAAPGDLARWRAVLSPVDSLDGRPRFNAPTEAREWWVTEDSFAGLEFFSPASITPRRTGWVGIHAASATIYIYTFTQ